MLTGHWGSGHRECPHTLDPCSLLNSGQAKLFVVQATGSSDSGSR